MTPEYIASKLALLPQFKVTSIDYEPRKRGKGFTLWGSFSERVGHEDQTTILYLSDSRIVEGLLLSAPEEQTVRQIEGARITYEDISEAELLTQSFSYFGANDPRRLRLVIDPAIQWQEVEFEPCKAIESRIIGTDGKPYVRRIPYQDGMKLEEGESIVEDAWDHEHCVFCWNTIDIDNAGYYGEYCGIGEWVCGWCYRNAVHPHDPRALVGVPCQDRDFELPPGAPGDAPKKSMPRLGLSGSSRYFPTS